MTVISNFTKETPLIEKDSSKYGWMAKKPTPGLRHRKKREEVLQPSEVDPMLHFGFAVV